MKKFKNLSRDEKIETALKYRAYRNERSIKARYLVALRKNDGLTLNYFENAGDSFRQIIENIKTFERAKLCGFTKLEINEYGRAEYRLKTVKKIEVCKSSIKIGITPNKSFVYGIWYQTGAAGGGWSPGIWNRMYKTQRDAEVCGLNYLRDIMIKGLEAEKTDSCGNYNKKLIRETLKEIEKIEIQNSTISLGLF